MRNSSLVKWFCAENVTGLKPAAEATAQHSTLLSAGGRGAFCLRGSRTARSGGAGGSENAGMSNDQAGENPVRRKPKVS